MLILSIVVAAAVSGGATFGGALVFDYRFNVETARDSPVWHPSENRRHARRPCRLTPSGLWS
jgi:hypothetical protein